MTKSFLSRTVSLWQNHWNISSLWKALTTVSRSGFDFATWPGLLAAATKFKSSNCTSSWNYVIPVGLTVKKLANQNFAATGGRRNEKMGVFVAGVPSSLAPVPLLPRSCSPSPSRLRLLRRLCEDQICHSYLDGICASGRQKLDKLSFLDRSHWFLELFHYACK